MLTLRGLALPLGLAGCSGGAFDSVASDIPGGLFVIGYSGP